MRRPRITLALTLAAGIALSGGPSEGGGPLLERASAGHGKNCGIVTKGSRNYRVWAQQMRCGRARKGAKRYLRRGKPLRGFTCNDDEGPYEFICFRGGGEKNYRAERL